MNPLKTALPVLVLLTSGAAFGQKLSHEFADLSSSQPVDVIVQYNASPTAEQQQRVVSRGGIFKAKHDVIRSVSYRIHASELSELQNDPDV